MKAVMLSLRPQWCEKIFNGEKTIEVRKSRPFLDMPFKVLIYCTKQKLTKTKCMNSYLHKNEPKACKKYGEIEKWCHIGDVHVNSNTPWSFRSYGMHGKVIGSFVCDRIVDIQISGDDCGNYWHEWSDESDISDMCLSYEELEMYLGQQVGYGWHITEPKLFDKPREIEKFIRGCDDMLDPQFGSYCGYCPQPCFLKRPPQSWCYVEEEK